MTIPFWQSSMFVHLVNLYRPQAPQYSAGHKATAGHIYVLAYSAVACYYGWTDNVSDAVDQTGLAKRPTLFTIDHILLPQGQEVGDLWAFKNVSLNADGTHDSNYGVIHVAQGAPNIMTSAGIWQSGHTKVMLFNPPGALEGVS